MKIVITNKKKFKIFSNIFRYLPVFMDTVNINVTDKGIYMQGMDTSQVCLFELKLIPEWFDTFERKKNYVLGLHCTTFYKVIQCIEDVEQTMTLTYDDGDKLNIAIESKEQSKVNKYFERNSLILNFAFFESHHAKTSYSFPWLNYLWPFNTSYSIS